MTTRLLGLLVCAAVWASSANAQPTASEPRQPAEVGGEVKDERGKDQGGYSDHQSAAHPLVAAHAGDDGNRHADDRKKHDEKESGNLWSWLRSGPLELFIALLGAAQLFFLWASTNAARRAAEAAERAIAANGETAQRQLRAYIGVAACDISFPKPAVPSVRVKFVNAGQTPATNVRIWIHQWTHRYPLEIELPEPAEDLVMASTTLLPGGHLLMTNEAKQPVLRDDFVHEMGTAEATVYVYGAVRYQDIFGVEHVTKYRFMHGGAEEVRSGFLKPCPHGNEST